MQPRSPSQTLHGSRQGLFGWVVAACIAAVSCGPAEPPAEPVSGKETAASSAKPFLPQSYAALMIWPDVFLVQGEARYLWVEGGQVLRIHHPSGASEPEVVEDLEMLQGLDGLVAAAWGPDHLVALLDASGRVIVLQESTGERRRFRIEREVRAQAIAVSQEEVFLLRASREPEGAAVVAFTHDGQPSGQWGEMPPDAAVQAKLSGGGLTVCPDGEVYFSYINSPRVFRLGDRTQGTVQPVGEPSTSFKRLDEGRIREVNQNSKRAGSVKELVQLGLQASRVMALFCAADGTLYRQVAQPGEGSRVEVIDPGAERRLEEIPVGTRVLLGVEGRALVLGERLPETRGLALHRMDLPTHEEG